MNWCPALGTVLANEEVTNEGRSERGNFPVYRRPLRQWMLRITAYAERLLADLDTVDWPEPIKLMQRNWIGAAKARVDFALVPHGHGEEEGRDHHGLHYPSGHALRRSYMVLWPEHPLGRRVDDGGGANARGGGYQSPSRGQERNGAVNPATGGEREKTGVFTGAYAINPVNGSASPSGSRTT